MSSNNPKQVRLLSFKGKPDALAAYLKGLTQEQWELMKAVAMADHEMN